MEDNKEETKTENSGTGDKNPSTLGDALDTINNLKKNTVERSEYEKLRAENKQLLEAMAFGKKAEEEDQKKTEQPKDLKKMREELFNPDGQLSNLEYATKALELREEVMKMGQRDPFLPSGKNSVVTKEDEEAANRVADVLKDCIDYAKGDSELFTNELQRRTIDVGPSIKRR